ncbi:hypothetical protein Tco_0357886, partial [Tanacetum coccineum]
FELDFCLASSSDRSFFVRVHLCDPNTAQPPTRTDEQIVPRSQWLTIRKSNLLFNAQKIQKNPIFQISVDILKNTNFFQAFEKTGVYSCQLDEQWFDLSVDLLRKALANTPVNPTHLFC